MMEPLSYLHGFRNHIESEALPNTLVKGRNSPQSVPYGLYAEQLSGSAFTRPRQDNLHSWCYRIHPSVLHGDFKPYHVPFLDNMMPDTAHTPPMQMRWDPMPYPSTPCHFIDGLFTFASNGSVTMQSGAAIHLYAATRSMQDEYFFNADGDFLIVPQEGGLRFKTEMGILDVVPGEIILIPRGMKFQVLLHHERARGYICENFGAPFQLPELGVIGANGLANPRDFCMPIAAYEERDGRYQLLTKFLGRMFEAEIAHSPLDVVAWHGNYVPYKYDLRLFNTLNSVSFDHPDPSIFTVLTSPSASSGIANVDFVIFPPRWMVADDTFRPPYFHRNIMSEFMGLIYGTYDAKETGFMPGGCSLHNCMSAHGPDAEAFNKAVSTPLKPEYYASTMAFMFESRWVWQLTSFAYHANFRQPQYSACWQGLKSHFKMGNEYV